MVAIDQRAHNLGIQAPKLLGIPTLRPKRPQNVPDLGGRFASAPQSPDLAPGSARCRHESPGNVGLQATLC